MNSQKFCLKWDAFHTSVTSLFDALRQDEELVDVTLCCEGQSFRAHRMMLSACSPYFRELLKSNTFQQTMIFLKDTSAEDLQAIIEFMYKGSVNVAQSQLASFIKTAEMLQIQGLSGSDEKDTASPPAGSPAGEQEWTASEPQIPAEGAGWSQGPNRSRPVPSPGGADAAPRRKRARAELAAVTPVTPQSQMSPQSRAKPPDPTAEQGLVKIEKEELAGGDDIPDDDLATALGHVSEYEGTSSDPSQAGDMNAAGSAGTSQHHGGEEDGFYPGPADHHYHHQHHQQLQLPPHHLGWKLRMRTQFTARQLQELEQEFCRNRYLTQERSHGIAADIGLTSRQVRIWFQNRRSRAKDRAGPTPDFNPVQSQKQEGTPDFNRVQSQKQEGTPDFNRVQSQKQEGTSPDFNRVQS